MQTHVKKLKIVTMGDILLPVPIRICVEILRRQVEIAHLMLGGQALQLLEHRRPHLVKVVHGKGARHRVARW